MVRYALILLVSLSLTAVLKGMPDDRDMLYEYRIAQLNKLSLIPLDYTPEVRRYIDLYTGPRKADMARIIGLSKLYFPIFEEALDRNNLPLELKYLTVVESGLNPLAVSKSGAVGLWQFLLHTSSLFDLKVTSLIDERCDPYRSTEAACRYFAYLHNTFRDWQLVLASYNGGPGETRKAIERCKGETHYWKLLPYLSAQAQNYVPAFIATFYLMNFYDQHGIVPEIAPYDYEKIDTLHLHYAVTFQQISSCINLPVETIRLLNPVYRKDYIPEQSPWSILVLPASCVPRYLQQETNILGFTPTPSDYHEMVRQSADTQGKICITHVVQPGEFTHRIAMKYHCTLEHIRDWNHLDSFEVKAGQKLIIWVDADSLSSE